MHDGGGRGGGNLAGFRTPLASADEAAHVSELLPTAGCGCEEAKREVVGLTGASAAAVKGKDKKKQVSPPHGLKSRGHGRLGVLHGSPQRAPQAPARRPTIYPFTLMTACN